ncbi:MAG: nucleotide exchange factor GrpE [Bacilli bacterium]|jgi:molecular chaperone GrpE|nr:nucleotide exchange factor GrpE [Bacilli bacterium]
MEEQVMQNEEEIKVSEETIEIKDNTQNSEDLVMEEAPPKEEKKKEKKKKFFDKEKEELRSANLELKEKVLRITAEMQNMRRRYDLDMQSLYKYDGYDLVEKLLPILDNFDRALKIKTEGSEKFLEGFNMIYENLISILNSKGITELDCLNKEFDPNIMNAVVTEVNNELEENTVLEVLQKGYMYNDRLIRPAMVKVSEKESE